MAKIKTSLKTKGRVKTASQNRQTKLQRNNRAVMTGKMTDHTSKGTGRYARRSSTPLKPKQAYKLEKLSLYNERAGLETKPEMIKAAGQAFAANVTPSTTSYAATAGASKIMDASSNKNQEISSLINGGVDQAGKSNDEELMEDSLPGGAGIR